MNNDTRPATKPDRDELRVRAREVSKRVLVSGDVETLLAQLEGPEGIHCLPPFEDISRAFRSNVLGALSTVSIPFRMSFSASTDLRYQQLHMAERIRSLGLPRNEDETEEEYETRKDRTALENANDSMRTAMRSDAGIDDISRNTFTFLERSLRDENFSRSANELLLQGVVLLWGAFEVLARDTFVALLNTRPQLLPILLADVAAKKRFDVPKISLDVLAQHGFNLSNKMGSLLAQQQDLSDTKSIKAAFGPLSTDEDIRNALDQPDLWLLSQRRNLVVHRRGLVDDAYRAQTHCQQAVGEHLMVAPDEIETHARTVVHAGSEILRCATTLARTTSKEGTQT